MLGIIVIILVISIIWIPDFCEVLLIMEIKIQGGPHIIED